MMETGTKRGNKGKIRGKTIIGIKKGWSEKTEWYNEKGRLGIKQKGKANNETILDIKKRRSEMKQNPK